VPRIVAITTALLAGLVLGLPAAAPSGGRRTALTPVQAVNRLLAWPWQAGLSRQFETEGEQAAAQSLEGKDIVGGGGSVGITYKGAGVRAKWSFGLRAKDVHADVDVAAPPGFVNADPNGFDFAAPLNGGWGFALSGDLEQHARVKVGGTTIFSAEPPPVHFGLRVTNLRLKAGVQLSTAAGADRPQLVKATITPQLTVGGAGAIPVSIPIQLTAELGHGKLTLLAKTTDLSIGLPDVSARLKGQLALSLLPSYAVEDVDVDLRQKLFGTSQGDAINLSAAFQQAELSFTGALSVKLKYVGRVEAPFALSTTFWLPSTDQLNQTINFLQPPLPRQRGENELLGRTPVPDPAIDYATPALQLEGAIAPRHLPYGAVLSLSLAPPLGRGRLAYETEEDSAIWTGHYLAAESMRSAATADAAALDRVKLALAGVKRLFDVTGDVAVSDGKRWAVTGGPGVLSRTARPTDDPVDFAAGSLEKRPCYYVDPEGGWRAGGRVFPTYSSIPAGLKKSALGLQGIQPVGRVWEGHGCGSDHPISRDQYVGVLYGLTAAYALVPDATVHETARKLIVDALDFLIRRGNWNIRLAPANRIETNFMGDFPKQLAFLRLGKTVDPARYGALYDEVAPAAELAWIPDWFSIIDPIFQYYKFNLAHAAFQIALLLETDPSLRASYLRSYGVLWAAVRHHKNAYFDLARVLMRLPSERAATAAEPAPSNPAGSPGFALSLGDEAKSLLGEWLTRLALAHSAAGLPTYAVSDITAAYLAALGPSSTSVYTALDGGRRCSATYALPVWARNPSGSDFIWQREPFKTGIPLASCGGRVTAGTLQPGAPRFETPAVDYLLAYWLAVYVGVLPKPS
jgi:hypothetical protein